MESKAQRRGPYTSLKHRGRAGGRAGGFSCVPSQTHNHNLFWRPSTIFCCSRQIISPSSLPASFLLYSSSKISIVRLYIAGKHRAPEGHKTRRLHSRRRRRQTIKTPSQLWRDGRFLRHSEQKLPAEINSTVIYCTLETCHAERRAMKRQTSSAMDSGLFFLSGFCFPPLFVP